MQDPHSHFLSLPRKLSKSGQKPSGLSRLIFVVLGVFLVILVANGVVASLLEGQIYPGVSVAGHDLSWFTRAQAMKVLREVSPESTITIKSDGKVFVLKSSELGASYDLPATVNMAYQVGREQFWPLVAVLRSNGVGQLGFAYHLDGDKFSAKVSNITSSVGRNPVNATLVVKDGQLEVVPPQAGVKINANHLSRLLNQALTSAKDQVATINPAITPADIQVDSTKPAQAQARSLMSKKITLRYEGRTFEPDAATIGHWLVFETVQERGRKAYLQTKVDSAQIKGYMQSLANQINKAPKNKSISVRDGVSSVEQEGKDGLAVNQDDAAKVLSTAMQDPQNATVYDIKTTTLPYKTVTNYSQGIDQDRYIEVNLSKQKMWVYDKHQVVFTSSITSGAAGAGFGTVTGTFSIYAKERNRYLNGRPYGWDYNVFVKYWMPFYGSYGLHDASWRSSFGGSDYYYGGSHGCVNMPEAAAAFLYSWADVGTTVWVHK